jgi:hypothetical protein
MKIQMNFIILGIFFLCKTISIFGKLDTTTDPTNAIVQEDEVGTENSYSTESTGSTSSSSVKQLTKHHENKVIIQCGLTSQNGRAGCGPGQYSSDGCNGCTSCPAGNNNTSFNFISFFIL